MHLTSLLLPVLAVTVAGQALNSTTVTYNSTATTTATTAIYSNLTTTVILTALTTVCPEPTVITVNDICYTILEPTTLTIEDCPCTVVKSVCFSPFHPQSRLPQALTEVNQVTPVSKCTTCHAECTTCHADTMTSIKTTAGSGSSSGAAKSTGCGGAGCSSSPMPTSTTGAVGTASVTSFVTAGAGRLEGEHGFIGSMIAAIGAAVFGVAVLLG
jgi:hypothetical protein